MFVGMVVEKVVVRDLDLVGNNVVFCYVIIFGNINFYFFIDFDDGIIIVVVFVNYEVMRLVFLVIEVIDFGFLFLFDKCIVNISIQDINDNVLEFFIIILIKFFLENVMISEVVIWVLVKDVDLDRDNNNVFIFRILFVVLFDVDFDIGDVIVINILD